jgi:DamX protein
MKRTSLHPERQGGNFYITPELTQRINLIHHLLQNSEQLLLVLADEHRGKSTLLHQVIATASEHWKIFTPASSPALSESALITTLLSAFNVRPEGKPLAAMRETLRSHIAATRYNGQLPILLVDDAHMLPLETLNFLVRLVMTGEPQTRMRVLLFCEPQITSIFAAPEFEIMRTTLIHTLDVPRFSDKQVRGYVKFQLAQVGYAGFSPFGEIQLRDLYQNTEGVAGRVEEHVKEMLENLPEIPLRPGHLHPAGVHQNIFKTRHLKLIIGMSGVFLLLLLLSSGLKSWLFSPQPTDDLSLSADEANFVVIAEKNSPTVTTVFPPPPPLAADTLKSEDAERTVREIVAALAPEGDFPPELEDNHAVTAPVPEIAPPPEIDTRADESDIPGVKSAAWLRRQTPQAYTLQILSTFDTATIPSFVERYKLQNEIAVFTSTYRTKPYYKVVYGIYPDRNTAEAALKALPAALRRETRPWPRTLNNIHAEIERQD